MVVHSPWRAAYKTKADNPPTCETLMLLTIAVVRACMASPGMCASCMFSYVDTGTPTWKELEKDTLQTTKVQRFPSFPAKPLLGSMSVWGVCRPTAVVKEWSHNHWLCQPPRTDAGAGGHKHKGTKLNHSYYAQTSATPDIKSV